MTEDQNNFKQNKKRIRLYQNYSKKKVRVTYSIIMFLLAVLHAFQQNHFHSEITSKSSLAFRRVKVRATKDLERVTVRQQRASVFCSVGSYSKGSLYPTSIKVPNSLLHFIFKSPSNKTRSSHKTSYQSTLLNIESLIKINQNPAMIRAFKKRGIVPINRLI